MTDSQWIFHAAEIGLAKKQDFETNDIINESYVRRLEDAMHISGIFSRTDIKFDSVKEQIKHIDEKRQKLYNKKHNILSPVSVSEQMMKEYDEVKDIAPAVLEVEEIDTFVENMPKVKVSRKRRNRNGGKQ